MKKELLLAIILCSFYALGFSQATGELKGYIENTTGTELTEFFSIQVVQNGKPIVATQADTSGNYWIKGIPTGTYTVIFSKVGFQTQTHSEVSISTDQIYFLNPKVVEGNDLPPVVFSGKPFELGPPGHEPIPRIEFTKYPLLNLLGIINSLPFVYSRDGKFGNFGGARQDPTIYINGVKIRNGLAIIPRNGAEAIDVYMGGIPAKYGDAVGGVIEVTLRNISNVMFGSVEARTSQFIDDYGHYYFSGTIGGPLIKRKGNNQGKSILGFLLSFEGGYDKDPQPGFGGWNRASDGTLRNIIDNPLRLPPAGQSGTRLNAEYLTQDNFIKTPYRMNAAAQYFNMTGKIDFAPGKNTFISVGGYMNAAQTMLWDRNNSMFNWENNGRNQSITGNVFGRFVQYFQGKKDDKGKTKGFKDAMISLQVDYLKGYSKSEDVRHQDNFFNYGYVGKFDIHRAPTYSYGYDPVANKSGYLFTGYQDTLVTFTPSTVNSQIAAITSQVYSLYDNPVGHYDQLSSMMNNGAVINGSVPRTVYDMYTNPGTPYNGYQIADNNQFRITFHSSATLGNHDLGFGFEFEQRNDAFYNLNPVELWKAARLLTNSHLGTLDTANPSAVYNQYGVYQDTINYQALYVADPNHPGFGLGQSFFDYSLRQKLGLATDGLDFINLDALDPNFLNINMFSADELLNNGNPFVLNSGYDAYGNRTSNNASLEDFFTARDQYGNLTRPVSAFQPTYMGGYIQDRFSFRDIVFNIGLRIDRYDANQKVLKDPYSLYDTKKAGDVNDLSGNPVTHPGNVQNDWVVYVNDVNNPTEVLGYRDGNTWYNAGGEVINDPTALRNSSGRVQPLLVEPNTDVRNPGQGLYNAFTDYVPQINVMPRIAFYFPMGEKSQFSAYYDVLTQRPTVFNGNRNLSQLNPIDYLFWDNTSYNSGGNIFNNPNLRPERTTDFSLSFTQIISDVMQIQVRAFYKELRDMVAIVKVQEAYPRSYTTWDNIDFGTSKGLSTEIILKPKSRNLNVRASYTLQFADGTGSGSFSQLNLINSGQPNLRSTIPLGYDSRHQFKVFAMFDFGDKGNPAIGIKSNYIGPKGKFGEAIFKNLNISMSIVGNSGVPYSRQVLPTPTQLLTGGGSSSLLGSLNGARLPFEMYCDLTVGKNINILFGKNSKHPKPATLQLYLNVQNLFNINNIVDVYRATGSPTDDGYLTSPNYQSQIESQVDPASYANYYTMKSDNPYNFSMPRRIKFGASLNF